MEAMEARARLFRNVAARDMSFSTRMTVVEPSSRRLELREGRAFYAISQRKADAESSFLRGRIDAVPVAQRCSYWRGISGLIANIAAKRTTHGSVLMLRRTRCCGAVDHIHAANRLDLGL
jgi:hypothetical protein